MSHERVRMKVFGRSFSTQILQRTFKNQSAYRKTQPLELSGVFPDFSNFLMILW